MNRIGTERTYQLLRDRHRIYWRVETFNQWSHKRMDLFTMWDVLVLLPDEQAMLGIQICAMGEENEHMEKIESAEWIDKNTSEKRLLLPAWKMCGGKGEIWAWGKRSSDGRGSRKEWQVRITQL